MCGVLMPISSALFCSNMDEIKIQDKSGDREFFTIIPNYIINHSTANDRALYLEMKRFAGEDGKCFATEKTMMERLKIGKKSFDKSLNYLLKRGWVSFIGLTEGKTRPIKTYCINNIWRENSDYFKKISAERTLSFKKISAESKGDKFQKQHKISAESNIEEEKVKEEKEEDTATPSVAVETQHLIELFKEVNPNYERLYSNTTQRAALERLVKNSEVNDTDFTSEVNDTVKVKSTIRQSEVNDTDCKDNTVKDTHIKVSNADGVAGDIPKFIYLFRKVSPNTYEEWFNNTTERGAAAKLLTKYPLDDFWDPLITGVLPILNEKPYNPKDCKAFKPTELLRNLDKIMSKYKELKKKGRENKNKYVKIKMV